MNRGQTWRRRVRIELTTDSVSAHRTVLKTGEPTSDSSTSDLWGFSDEGYLIKAGEVQSMGCIRNIICKVGGARKRQFLTNISAAHRSLPGA